MHITIHRGSDQIGGCVTEYEHNGWRLFVDYGEQLPGAAKSELKIEGLTHGDFSKSALLITHYHGDHVGCIAELPENLPIFIGQIAKEILDCLTEHLGHFDEKHKMLNSRLKSVKTFSAGVGFEWGEFRIMPIIMDHSAFDAYAFGIETQGLKVFHTGDFRTHGFRSGKLPKVIERYIGKVDYVVCEATNVCRPSASVKSEHELQKNFIHAFTENMYNVVYLSSTNVDRLFGLYHAALRAHRTFYVDGYQKKIMDIVADRDPIWGKSRLYKYKEGFEPKVLQRDGDDFHVNDNFKEILREHGYVIVARGNSRFNRLLSTIPSDGRKTYLSMWQGYIDVSNPSYSRELAQSIPTDYEYFHSSGHCDMKSMETLFGMLNPKAIIPIHTDSPQAFAELFCDKWPVLKMNDGESFSPIKESGFNSITGIVLAKRSLESDIQIVANPNKMNAWSLDNRHVGEFRLKEDALCALRHVSYAPKRFIGYSVVDYENMDPYNCEVYDIIANHVLEYKFGNHKPGGTSWQETCNYNPGDKVYCIYYAGFKVIIPCEVVGPITEEFVKKQFEEDESAPDSYEEYVSYITDWDWDTVIVKPLVRLKNQFEELPELIAVNRVYLFPHID